MPPPVAFAAGWLAQRHIDRGDLAMVQPTRVYLDFGADAQLVAAVNTVAPRSGDPQVWAFTELGRVTLGII